MAGQRAAQWKDCLSVLWQGNLTPHEVTWTAGLGRLWPRGSLSRISNYKWKASVAVKECPKLMNRCGKQIWEQGEKGRSRGF